MASRKKDPSSPSGPAGFADGVGFSAEQKDDVLDLYLYDEISPWGASAKQFAQALADAPDAKEIHLFVNSPGGSVWDGLAIYNLLRRHPAQVIAEIDGVAASAASLVVMAADRIRMAENAIMMIHEASGFCYGRAGDMKKTAQMLGIINAVGAKTYAARSGQTPEAAAQMMADETWLDADAALDEGFSDETIPAKEAVAVFDLSMYAKAPKPSSKTLIVPRSLQEIRQRGPLYVSASLSDQVPWEYLPEELVALVTSKEQCMSAENAAAAAEKLAAEKAVAEAKAAAEKAVELKLAAEKEAEAKAAAEKVAALRVAAGKGAAAKAAADQTEAQKANATAKTVVEMCQAAGYGDLGSSMIGESVEDVRADLFGRMCKDRKPIGDAGGNDAALHVKNPDQEYVQEYRDNAASMSKLGVTEEEYVKSRKEEAARKK